ncbi:MAG: cell surface protein SprA, partial [Chitinophagaceae bacterium]
MGLRLDYMAKTTAKESLSVGGSMVRLGERPFFTKTNINEDPIRNTMYGLDFNYNAQSQRLTRLLDKLPFYSTNEMSTVTAYGEAALFKPGHPPQIGKGSNGLIFIDDFEGSRNSIDLRFPLIGWGLSSTPQGTFPEATLRDSLEYGYNRAKIAWYNIEPVLQDKRNLNNPVRSIENFNDPRIRPVNVTQLYPNRTPDFGQAQLVTFDLAFYPTDKGPYNFDTRPNSVTPEGKLLSPEKRWGGIMRGLDQVDFETGNVEFIEMWIQDPFLLNPASTGGEMYFDLGNISEDVLRDGKRFFENGISGLNYKAAEDSSGKWGKVPANPLQVTQAFSNDPADRKFQDAGFDGLTDEAEQRKFQSYLNQLRDNFGSNSAAYIQALNDPSGDDYRNYRDAYYDQTGSGILGRYKNINNPQGNSPIAGGGEQFVNAFTLYPDQEEFNRDNTLNELEEYFEYKIQLRPYNSPVMQVGNNFITDKREFTPSGGIPERWYLFRVPIAQYFKKVGQIPDFKSIRFMRIFLNGFTDSVIVRFAKFEMVRNNWRRFNYDLDTSGQYLLIPNNTLTTFNQLSVNIEENSSRKPVVYKTPPGVIRQQQLSNNNVNVLLNEQSLSMQICKLPQNEARGVFKTVNLDLRQFDKMQMYWHAESVFSSGDIKDGSLYAVLRFGNDLMNNYYEIRIPLVMTPWGTTDANVIWPSPNELEVTLEGLTKLKVERNSKASNANYYKKVDGAGREYAILGNPNLGEVRVFFLGVENRKVESACAEVWVNELRLAGMNEKPGWAALGRVDFKLADLGSLYVSGSAHSTGFGTLEQRINQRSRDNYTQLDVATNLELGKLLPKKAGVSIPVYASFQQTVSAPQFDPYDLDLTLKSKLNGAPKAQRDSIRGDAVDVKTIKSINFTNVKKNNTSGKKQKIWSPENVDVSYSFYQEQNHNSLIENNTVVRHRGGVGYNFTTSPKFWEPMKKVIKSKTTWLSLIKDININPMPSLLGFRADMQRQFGAFRPRNVGGPKGGLPETYDKFFTFDRIYNLRWDLTKSINIDYSATNKAW